MCEGSAVLRSKMQVKKDQFEELQNAMDLVGFEADVCVYVCHYNSLTRFVMYNLESRKPLHLSGSCS